MSGLVDESKMVEMGKLLGAEAVVFGAITSTSQNRIDKFAYDVLRTEIGIDIRVVSATSGKILLSESAKGVCDNKIITTSDGTIVSGSLDDNSGYAAAARSAIDSVGVCIANLAVLLGYVVDVSKNQIAIDVGEEQGVKPGLRFILIKNWE